MVPVGIDADKGSVKTPHPDHARGCSADSPIQRRCGTGDALAASTAAEKNPKERAKALFRRVLVRDPSEKELSRILGFLGESPGDPAWSDLALTLLNSNEFLYVP